MKFFVFSRRIFATAQVAYINAVVFHVLKPDFFPQFKYVSCFQLHKVTVILCVFCSSSEDTQGRDCFNKT